MTTGGELSKITRQAELARHFTPSAPVSTIDLFAGRAEQIVQVLSVLNQPGRHAVLYGERGVGKTSLANLITRFASPNDDDDSFLRAARVNCSTEDTFASIWRRIFRSGGIPVPEEWAYRKPDPDEIRMILSNLDGPRRLIVIDEFDRWVDDEGLSLMADTIKSLADHAVETKIVLVGVADSIDELVGEHDSIQRCIEQVSMPRMTKEELTKIPTTGFERAQVAIDPDALALIVNLSEGLPHYAHFLSLHAGQRAVQDDRNAVTREDVFDSVKFAVRTHTVLSEYTKAVQAQRSGTLHERVLLACALAKKDELGFFTAADVRGPMSEVMGRSYDIPAFSPHLKAFTEFERGAVLRRVGVERRFRYRFRNPLIQPFAVLHGLSSGKLPEKYRKMLFEPVTDDYPTLPLDN